MMVTRAVQRIAILLAASFLGFLNAALGDVALDPVIVNGARMGPRLWHVRHDAAQLWILGTISPLPVGATWRAGEVEHLLGGANTVLAARPMEITAPRVLWILITQRDLLLIKGGHTLKEVMAPDLYARFAALRMTYAQRSRAWERYRPIIASALLEDEALKQHGLSQRLDVSLAVRRLAAKHHVAVDEVKIPGAPDLLEALRSVAPDVENRCVAAILDAIERDIPLLADRARAWSSGDLERISALPESTESICGALMSADTRAGELLARIHQQWLAALEGHLQRGGITIAVIDVDLLLGRGGLLAALRGDGYAVEAP
jgi:uncharacterized protein YbaP (TraB family)